jgi:hypothetical protein
VVEALVAGHVELLKHGPYLNSRSVLRLFDICTYLQQYILFCFQLISHLAQPSILKPKVLFSMLCGCYNFEERK